MNKKSFVRLLDKYLAREPSLEEEEEEGLLNIVYKNFQNINKGDIEYQEMPDGYEERLFEQINEVIAHPENRPNYNRIRKLRTLKYVSAACVLIGFTLGINYFNKSGTSKSIVASNPSTKDDLKPGINKAYLILSSGQTIVLNDARTGTLARQGSKLVIKENDGQIAYKSNGLHSETEDSALQNKIVVPRGGQYKITLPDGTIVWMNSYSSLTYPVHFSGKNREVTLMGEAYFEVTKNKLMPFTVNVNDKMNINVLGTHFNVMAYDTENRITTTLLEGAIKIEDRQNVTNTALMTPGQQANMFRNDQIKVYNADVDEAIAWKEGRFSFNKENIYSITRKLSRWYDVDFIFTTNLADKSFDGTISKYKNISEILKLIELTKGVHFKIQGRRIMVLP